MVENGPTVIHAVRRENGVAGQVAFHATVQYQGEPDRTVLTFVGSVAYGGPVVMVSPSGAQTFVTDPGRFGDFGEVWVSRFLLCRPV